MRDLSNHIVIALNSGTISSDRQRVSSMTVIFCNQNHLLRIIFDRKYDKKTKKRDFDYILTRI